ncbi:hypothetical protein HAP47_0019895 [Bradyrhizobium sp. 41S5]|uniref:hypothetical protein n=1 Tax=Bradyrhizobium sp. 41S5 TaxID=1404443 RepID=UPI00156B2FAB|nr:hypothetical protein [Bradyrhizobium sp. 41S5]UFX48797.1 hypothetical protein HAP47_0019895 [Bradyrhizobium sp. 41S5]
MIQTKGRPPRRPFCWRGRLFAQPSALDQGHKSNVVNHKSRSCAGFLLASKRALRLGRFPRMVVSRLHNFQDFYVETPDRHTTLL